jgi:hypothetical protein
MLVSSTQRGLGLFAVYPALLAALAAPCADMAREHRSCRCAQLRIVTTINHRQFYGSRAETVLSDAPSLRRKYEFIHSSEMSFLTTRRTGLYSQDWVEITS